MKEVVDSRTTIKKDGREYYRVSRAFPSFGFFCSFWYLVAYNNSSSFSELAATVSLPPDARLPYFDTLCYILLNTIRSYLYNR